MSEAKTTGAAVPTRRFNPYPAYKDSGVEWLGEIPAHWMVTRLKRIGSLQAGAGFPENEQGLQAEELPFFKVGDMGSAANEREMNDGQHTISVATARRLRAFVFPPRTIVFAKVGVALLLNRRRLLTRRSCLDNNMMGFTPGACDVEWAFHWLNGLDLARLANPGAVPSVNEGQMRDTPVVLPPENEQVAIAAFLDRETARIDGLVAKKERLIELLREKRAALITRAVTKGLDPNVPMKDSDIEWLGQIPAHWQVKRLRHLGEATIGLTYEPADVVGPDDQGVLVLRASNVTNGHIVLEDNLFVRCAILDRLRTKLGDILICSRSGSRALIGKNAKIDRTSVGVTFGTFMTVFRSYCNDYLFRAFNSTLFDYQSGAFLTSTINQLTVSNLKGFTVPVPPDGERAAIATFLGRETVKIDALVAEVREAIDRLKELRIALISAAVTGKIDVRAA